MTSKVQPVYVNDLRIGGVDDTTSTLDDLWKLLYHDNTEEPKQNSKVAEIIQQYEKEWQVTIPEDLKRIACWDHIEDIIFEVFPTNNCWITPGQPKWYHKDVIQQWRLLKDPSPEDYMIRIINENQGCFFWYVGWKKGDNSCRVYVSSYILPEIGYTQTTDKSYSNLELTGTSLVELTGTSLVELTGTSLVQFLVDYAKEGEAWYRENW